MFAFQDEFDSDDAYLDFSDSENESEGDPVEVDGTEMPLLRFGQQKQRCKRSERQLALPSHGGSDFEQEMEAELSRSVAVLPDGGTAEAGPSSAGGQTLNKGKRPKRQRSASAGTSDDGASASEYYDNVYFESSSDDEGPAQDGGASAVSRPGKSRSPRVKNVRVLTNDELFYDPDIDDENEDWVANQLRRHRGMSRKGKATSSAGQQSSPSSDVGGVVRDAAASSSKETDRPRPAPRSDAVLACPACMTTLCIDCQRHDIYKTQFRAMFVMNCTIVRSEVLHHKIRLSQPTKRKKRRGKGAQSSPAENAMDCDKVQPVASAGQKDGGEETYHPVQCTACETEVAVYDRDEIYHFFNILASHA